MDQHEHSDCPVGSRAPRHAGVVRATAVLALLVGGLTFAPRAAAAQRRPAQRRPAAGPGSSSPSLETKPFAAFSESARSLRDSVVALARAQVGTPYVRGGQSPERGFDCSGLVRYVMASLHVELPRTARQQASVGETVGRDTSRLQPGDLLTFGRKRHGVSHVGIYIGDGRFIHASSVAGRVIESALDRPASALIKAWRDARRLPVVDEGEVALVHGGRSGT